ncbi:hypothetical protein GJ496_001250 [Pomphorhynchus laevis]|nr:hypothetical protein GJ496_001250 [Pomphorhynchus laevis]
MNKELTPTVETTQWKTTEHERINGDKRDQWLYWGPYVSDRAWGTVREDLSADGNAWDWFPYSHAIHRAYRWNEDGIGAISDIKQTLCLGFAFWNGRDSHIKERFFGLTNSQGNHGEDVKEVYFYVDNLPSHAYMKMVYVYPQSPFPYKELIDKNAEIKYKHESEYELFNELTNDFEQNNLFKIDIEYAKIQWNDILGRITVKNLSREHTSTIHVLPQLWFRNQWDYPPLINIHNPQGKDCKRPKISLKDENIIVVEPTADDELGGYYMYFDKGGNNDEKVNILFTENETNMQEVFGIEKDLDAEKLTDGEENETKSRKKRFYKDAINDSVINDDVSYCNPDFIGSKVAVVIKCVLRPEETTEILVRLSPRYMTSPFVKSNQWFEQRIREADKFYGTCFQENTESKKENMKVRDVNLTDDISKIQRSAYAGLLWSKQFFNFDVKQWLYHDPNCYKLNPHHVERNSLRNKEWTHMQCHDIISMPDKWEYPWFAVWDLAFHTIPIASIDPQFAKEQLLLFLDERYLHPSGQIPAYEWQFGDVNPPVHAWAVWRVYKTAEKLQPCNPDNLIFLERSYHKLLLNFTWWINRKDVDGHNVFEGGFLGMDNIGVFDRSHPLPTGGSLEQADGTAWMAMYCINMMVISLQLTTISKSYEDLAIKFLDHFILIANTMSNVLNDSNGLWDADDEFFFDVLCLPNGSRIPLKVRSFVGLIPLFATETLENEWLIAAEKFSNRINYYKESKMQINNIASLTEKGKEDRILISALSRERFEKIMKKVLDKDEFLSDYGIRTLSKFHDQNPYTFTVDGQDYTVRYEPGESMSVMFGGNSNWRGPIWFPVNYMLLESLQKYYSFYGIEYQLECPTNSRIKISIDEIVKNICDRLIRIFRNTRRYDDRLIKLMNNCEFKKCLLYYEYYNGNDGSGLGASHQTGWTSLIAKIIEYSVTEGKYRAKSIFINPATISITE